MSGHLLLFGQDITRPTPAVHAGNGAPYGEIQFPGGVITYRDLAGIDEAITAHAELRAMLAAAQAQAAPLAEYQAASDEIYYASLDPDCRDGKHTSCTGGPCECGCHGGSDSQPDPYIDAIAAEHGSEYEDAGGLGPLPPLPQRTPAGPPGDYRDMRASDADDLGEDYEAQAHALGLPWPPDEDDPPEPGGQVCDECNYPLHACPACGVLIGHDGYDDHQCGPQPGGTIYPQLTEEALAGAEPLGQLAPEPEEDEAQA